VISFPKGMKYNLIVFKLNIFQAPSSVEESTDTLAKYLAKPAQNDLEKSEHSMFGSVRILGMVTSIYSSSYQNVLERT
jgi:hypothetical protein